MTCGSYYCELGQSNVATFFKCHDMIVGAKENQNMHIVEVSRDMISLAIISNQVLFRFWTPYRIHLCRLICSEQFFKTRRRVLNS